MSRILEALQKARGQRAANGSELPNVDEVVTSGEQAASVGQMQRSQAYSIPSDILEMVGNGSPELIRSHRCEWKIKAGSLVFLSEDANGNAQEQFRTLRSRLYQMRGAGKLQVIVVSSALTGEGKSLISLNMAHAFSLQKERRVLLIDADLRRADGISDLLGIPPSSGLSDYLLGEQNADSIIQTGSQQNLYVIPSGKRVENAGELIGAPRLRELIEQMRPAFDWIVIDTPPVVPIADAPLISDLADGVLLVVNSRSTPAQLAKRAVQQFRQESLLGVVLNRAAEPSASYYSAYGYGYGMKEIRGEKNS